MINKEEINMLRGMGRDLFSMLEGLNNSKNTCKCCGLGRYEDYSQHLWKERLSSSARNLFKVAQEIEDSNNHSPISLVGK
jgi:hypothetical protein